MLPLPIPSGGVPPLPIPSGCIVNDSLRRVQHFFFPQPTGRAACCRSQFRPAVLLTIIFAAFNIFSSLNQSGSPCGDGQVPSSCIINESLRRTINFTSSRQLNVINLRLDREHHKVFRQAFFQKGLPPEAYRKLKLMILPGTLHVPDGNVRHWQTAPPDPLLALSDF